MVSIQYIKECLRYSKEAGELFWNERPVGHFPDERAKKSWNTKYAGKRAGTVNHGYLIINLNGFFYRAHKIIFLIEHGIYAEVIDHINGDRLDNRICNLRQVTHSQNMMNRPTQKNNKSGLKGVSLHPGGLWRARIWVKRKEYFLGFFKTKELAFEAYCEAAKTYHGEYANTTREWSGSSQR